MEIALGPGLDLFSLAIAAFLQDPKPSDQDLPDVLIEATSPLNPAKRFNTPYQADALTGRRIQIEQQARTLPEALKEIPGVHVQKTGHGQGSPFIRGFTGYRNLLLMDGIRLNNGIQRQGPNQYWGLVDPYLLDRLEVVRGPSSVLHGSDALGGTVALYSRRPDLEPGVHGHGRTVLRWAGGEDSMTARQEVWGGADNFAAMAGATYRGYGDIRAGSPTDRQRNTGYDGWDGDLKTVLEVAPDHTLTAAFQRTELTDAPRTHRTNRGVSWHGTAVGTDLRLDFDDRRQLSYLQYHWKNADAFFDELQASFSWQEMMERESRIDHNRVEERRFFTDDTLGLWMRLRSDTDIGTLTYGWEWYRDFIDSEGRDRRPSGAVTTFERGVVSDDTTYDLFGAYLQDEFEVGDFTFIVGGRFYFAGIDADQVDFSNTDGLVLPSIDEEWSSAVGSARALYHAGEHWNLIAGVSQGFRAPSVHDLTAIALKLSGTLEVPSPDLDPERTTTFELGTRADTGSVRGELFGYVTDMNDVIERVLGPNPFFPTFGAAMANTRTNLGDGNVYGIEAGVAWEIVGGLTVSANGAWAFGETEQVRAGHRKSLEPADKVNPMAARVGIKWQPEPVGWWVEGIVAVVGSQDRLSASDATDVQRIPPGGTPGYTLYGIRGGYRFEEYAALTAALENIGDKDYRTHGSGSNEPGFNAILGLELTY